MSSAVDDPVAGNNDASATTTVQPAVLTPRTYVVDSNGDGGDADIADGVCATAGGTCTLRAAIQQANVHPTTDTIAFNLPGSGVRTIEPAQLLPTVTDPTVIDGTTQPGFVDRPLVEVSGAGVGVDGDGLVIQAGGSTVRGLIVNRFSGWAVHLTNLGGDVVAGNFIGTVADGSLYVGTGKYDGVFVDNVPTCASAARPARPRAAHARATAT